MNRQQVGFPEQRLEIHQGHRVVAHHLRGEIRVVGDDPKAEGNRPRGNIPPDVAEGKDPQRRPAELVDRLRHVFVPDALVHQGVQHVHLARHREDETHGRVRNLVETEIGDVGDGDTALGGCRDVHGVQPDAVAADDQRVVQLRDDAPADLRRRVQDRVGIAACGDRRLLRFAHRGDDLAIQRLEDIDLLPGREEVRVRAHDFELSLLSGHGTSPLASTRPEPGGSPP